MTDWIEAERSSHSFVRELQRLKRRAKARPIGFVLLAALLASAVVYKRSRRPETYKARVVMVVTEGELSTDRTPLPRKELRDYVTALSFTRARLLSVVEEHDLYPARAVRGDDYAAAAMRSNLKVEVYRNYFANDRGFETARRSARIGIIFRDSNPERATRVARRVAELIAETESRRREQSSSDAVDQSRAISSRARTAMEERRTQLTEALLARDRARTANERLREAELSLEIERLEQQLEADRTLVRLTEADVRDIELRAALDTSRLGLSFEVADEHAPEARDPNAWLVLAALGVVSFVFLLPLCAIGVGAFDSRVHDLEDVERLGLDVVGHVPGFRGDRVGSLDRRGAPRNRVP
ncbi:MAG TPA: hypothetical protein VML75_28130 [Kofleriaceae bacterium]|nr:hypothetical protein [Kofleriaceae bacterium]